MHSEMKKGGKKKTFCIFQDSGYVSDLSHLQISKMLLKQQLPQAVGKHAKRMTLYILSVKKQVHLSTSTTVLLNRGVMRRCQRAVKILNVLSFLSCFNSKLFFCPKGCRYSPPPGSQEKRLKLKNTGLIM